MELHFHLLLFLDKRHYLEDMKHECVKFCETELNRKTINKFPPLRFTLEIDVMDLLDTFHDVGDFLIKEPLKFQRICNEVLFACFRSAQEDIGEIVQPEQTAVLLRVKSLPKLLTPSNTKYYSGLVSFEGVLIARQKPEIYVYHTVWSCPEDCEGSDVILHFIPKVPRKCCVCKSALFENGGLRRCGEQVKATFKLENSPYGKNFNIVDDLIPKLELGSKYFIYAAVLQKFTIVLSLEEIVPLYAPLTTPIPKDIAELYKACDGIPWKFIYCLASSIGFNICPLNCFMHLKISLLVSLSSIKANILTGSNIVHVLVAGFDTRYVGEIMKEAAQIADKSVYLGTANASVSTTLLASSGGVCVMPLPLHVYSQKQISFVLAAIEIGEVTTESDMDKGKLQSAVWAQGMDFKKIVVANVASVFGTVCRGDLGEYSDEISDFVLQRAIKPVEISNEEKETLKDMALYIDLIAGLEVVLDDSAETLLRHYFLSARKERQRNVSVGSMKALVATCVTSARLCRRRVANIEDAVLAIWLHVSGSPEPRFAPEEYLQTPHDVKKLSKMINSFKEWLVQFTGTYVF